MAIQIGSPEERQLTFTKGGYQDLKGNLYDKSVFGYTRQGEALPTVTPIQQVSGPAASTSVTTGGIVPQTMPAFSGPIPASQAGPVTPLNLGTPTPSIDYASPMVAGAAQTAKNLTGSIAEMKTPEAAQASAAQTRLSDLLGQTAGQAQNLAREEEARGVEQKRQAFSDLNSQILTKNAEYKQLQDQFGLLSAQNEGKPITMNSIIGANAQVDRVKQATLNGKASEIGLLQATALGMQGQIEAAQDAAKRANDLKYAPILEEIAIKQAQLKALEPILTAQEKAQAAALSAANDLQKYQVQQAQTDANEFDKVVIQGLSNSMPKAIADQARSLFTAGNKDAAYAVMSKYTGQKTQDANAPVTNALKGLTNSQINTTVNQIAGSFDNEQLVKDFNQINAGYKLVQGLSNTSKNPADDQALIYAFAKVMDPGSVVREGEYNTVQKYSQSWVNSFGKSVTQAAAGTGFLSADARANIKKTIESKYNTSLGLYQDLKKQYEKRIETAKGGGMNSITDYNTSSVTPQNGPKLLQPSEIPQGYYQASDGLLYKK